MKPPKWSDDDKVAKWVGKIVDDENTEAEMLDAQEEALRDYPPMWMSEVLSSMEREAIEATKDGNLELLADMIENPMFNGKLSPKAWSIIVANLRGEFKTRRGPKRRPDSSFQRDLIPAYGAEAEIKRITAILKEHYPKEKAHRERAIGIAAARAGISRRELDNHLKSRHR